MRIKFFPAGTLLAFVDIYIIIFDANRCCKVV